MSLNLMQQQYRSKQLLCGTPCSNLQHNYSYSMVKLERNKHRKTSLLYKIVHLSTYLYNIDPMTW